MSLAFEKDTEVDLIESVKSGFDLMASIESEIDWVNSIPCRHSSQIFDWQHTHL